MEKNYGNKCRQTGHQSHVVEMFLFGIRCFWDLFKARATSCCPAGTFPGHVPGPWGFIFLTDSKNYTDKFEFYAQGYNAVFSVNSVANCYAGKYSPSLFPLTLLPSPSELQTSIMSALLSITVTACCSSSSKISLLSICSSNYLAASLPEGTSAHQKPGDWQEGGYYRTFLNINMKAKCWLQILLPWYPPMSLSTGHWVHAHGPQHQSASHAGKTLGLFCTADKPISEGSHPWRRFFIQAVCLSFSILSVLWNAKLFLP